MKNNIAVTSSAVLALMMLLPIAKQVNATSVNQQVFGQGGNPSPKAPGTGGGGFAIFGQGGNPSPKAPGTGGGGFTIFGQGGNPSPKAPGTGGGK
jgi:hypothetical protein